MSNTYETILWPISKINSNKLSKRTIDYTQTTTFYPNTVKSTLVIGLGIFIGHKLISSISDTTISFTLNQKLSLQSYTHNYSISSNNFTSQINVTPCSIAACKSIRNASTNNEVYQLCFDSGSSKTLAHKHIVPQNFIPISSNDDLGIFLIVGATTPMALRALEKIRFLDFNCNMIVG